MVGAANPIEKSPQGDLPVVLIATDDPVTSAYIGKHLRRSGFNTRISIYDGKTLHDTPRRIPKAILMCFKDHCHVAAKVQAALKKRYAPHELTFIGTFPNANLVDSDAYDSVIFPPAHPAQIASRVHAMIRIATMQREISLRIETLKEDFGLDYQMSPINPGQPFRVLFIGQASPQFMIIINALETKNVDVVAAFTSFSAFDFLHESTFDAVVMNTLTANEPAFTICETMRRNSRLFHTPTLFLTGEEFTSHDIAYEKGATDVIPFASSPEEISGRILELANYHRLHQSMKDEFSKLGGERCTDHASGTYNRLFFYAHLRRVCAADAQSGQPTSLLLVRIRPKTGEMLDPEYVVAAYDQIGGMINNMVRMEDIVGRMDDHVFAVAFSGQSPEKLSVVVDRISGIIDCTAFKSGQLKQSTFQVDLDITLSAIGPDAAETLKPQTLSSGSNTDKSSLKAV